MEYYHLNVKDLSARKAPGSFVNLKRPDDLPSFKKTVARLEKAISSGEKTVIYGDYDVDGLTSTAILTLALRKRGLKNGFFIPSRYKEGYGLSIDRVREFHEKGYQLIITLDNGITAFEAVSEARKLGMDVVIIDHHENQTALPDADYIFHQSLSGFIDYNCSAASLSFFVSSALLHVDDPYLATLAGIAVFSDVMPLLENNLELAKIALSFINEKKFENLVYLLGEGPYSYEDLSFTLIPALNSPGRICKDSLATNNVCRFLLSDKDKDIEKFGSFIRDTNQKRKDIVKGFAFEEKNTLQSEHGLVIKTDSYPGLSGLFANKIMRQDNKPIAVFAPEEDNPDILSGSLRAPDPYHVDSFLTANSRYFLSCGGHEKAAGLRIKKKDFFQVATLFLTECEKQSLEKTSFQKKDSIAITLDDLNPENYLIYESFFPFGEGFPAPSFSLSVDKKDIVPSRNGNAFFVYSNDRLSKAVYFGSAEEFLSKPCSYLVLEGTFKKEIYNGKITYSLLADKVIPESD